MRINHNIAALNTYRQLTIGQGAAAKNMEKLSSGLRINRAGDDAAGLAISEKMRGQIRGLEQASRNAQDGISLIQTAEGALNEVHSILQRMRELAVQAANDTNTVDDRGEIQKEINQLTSEINRIGNTTEFNTQKLLNGTRTTTPSSTSTPAGQTTGGDDQQSVGQKTGGNGQQSVGQKTGGNGQQSAGTIEITLQIGANQSQSLTIDIQDMRARALGITGTAGTLGFTATNTVTDGTNNATVEAALDVSNATDASAAITKIQKAIDKVSAERSKLGAYQNRLEHTINNLSTSAENLQAAESRIRDVDYALAA
ncbi:flagellin [Geobacillus stearothermophilus]|uniref:flagellin N-terminal helical domain-containing protein n=1 Tax=Geobacillus stearothermophilus TaxID=1422 RepID=UPI002E1DD805|nr:flagellin [Geobacillus stearothermophilus]MED3747278.1 flagellin [Geobacillus stearothermophilus]MED3753194.1 flagellin [Geobacillus stearothermophilus]